jgi:hypothetical protein
MTEPTPRFVLDYIAYLKKLYNQYPDAIASRFNLSMALVPAIIVEPYFDSARGWAVIQRHPVTGIELLSEFIEPPFASKTSLPPLNFDPTAPFETPKYAPPQGYFVLLVDNVGLPPGYAATTTVNIQPISTAVSINNAGSGFVIPFRGQYELPVLGTTGANARTEQLRYNFSFTGRIKTVYGEYEPLGPFYSIFPQSGELHKQIIQWVKVGVPNINIVAPAPSAQVLPPAPMLPVTGPISKITEPTVPTGKQTQPVFYPSTTPPRPAPLPPVSTTYKLEPLSDPKNTFRANTVQDMFSFTPDTSARKIVYHLGVKPINILPTNFKVRNNTLNTTLQFKFNVPEFLFLNVPLTLKVKPQQEVIISVSFNERDAQSKSLSSTRLYTDTFSWSVMPIDVTGPVLVVRNLQSVSSDNLGVPRPLIQSSPPASGIIGTRSISDTNFFKRLYITVDPMELVLTLNERRTIRLNALVGGTTLDSSRAGAMPLQFEANSILWEVKSTSTADIESQNSAGSAVLTGVSVGRTEFKAKIIKPPINISKNLWDQIYNSQVPISGGARRVLLPNAISGIEVSGVITVVPQK